MNLLVSWLVWLIAPTLFVVVVAVVLSLLPIDPPKIKPGPNSWFKEPDA